MTIRYVRSMSYVRVRLGHKQGAWYNARVGTNTHIRDILALIHKQPFMRNRGQQIEKVLGDTTRRCTAQRRYKIQSSERVGCEDFPIFALKYRKCILERRVARSQVI